jgi:hypothetical protein
MDSSWRKLARPAAVGFVVGLILMAGLAVLAPSPERGVDHQAEKRH